MVVPFPAVTRMVMILFPSTNATLAEPAGSKVPLTCTVAVASALVGETYSIEILPATDSL